MPLPDWMTPIPTPRPRPSATLVLSPVESVTHLLFCALPVARGVALNLARRYPSTVFRPVLSGQFWRIEVC